MRKVILISAIALVSTLTVSSAYAAKTDIYNYEGQKVKYLSLMRIPPLCYIAMR